MTDETSSDSSTAETVPQVDPAVTDAMRRTYPWVRFFSIVGLVTAAFMVLASVLAGRSELPAGTPETTMLLFGYPILALVYVIPSLYLFRYAGRIRHFLATGLASDLAAALDDQQMFWRIVGIITAVSMLLALLVAIAVALGGVPPE